MRRRDFIYNTGLLLPGLFLSGPLAMASNKTIEAAMLIIHDEANPAHVVNTIFNQATAINVHQVSASAISDLVYSKKGFVVTTHDNKTFLVQKMVVHAPYQLHAHCVKLNMGTKAFHLEYTSVNDNSVVRPEYWFLKTSQFQPDKVIPFIQRNRHAVLCMTGS
ncbi:MAG: hypothetical protein ACJ751_01205 [Niastella sp.]|uniref:hypothetical protein n=1 Tax=Niastella sp. TaxID=1869183 RepID=UPI00389ABEAF